MKCDYKFISIKHGWITLISVIFIRLICVPFFAAIMLISLVSLWIKTCFNYILLGGEAIVYSRTVNRKSIADIFNKLKAKEII